MWRLRGVVGAGAPLSLFVAGLIACSVEETDQRTNPAGHMAGSAGATAGAGGEPAAGTSGGGIGGGGGDGGGGIGGSPAVQQNLVEQLPCLQELFAECPLEGACVEQIVTGSTADLDAGITSVEAGALDASLADASGASVDAGTNDLPLHCFDNGVRLQYVADGACTERGQTLVEARKLDGSLCFTYELLSYIQQACEVVNHTWRNANGDTVATGGTAMSRLSAQCTDGTGTFSCDHLREGCDGFTPLGEQESACEPGVCPTQ